MPMCTDTLICDTSAGTPHPYVPEQFRHTVFNSLHRLSHPDVQVTLQLITSRHFWCGMNANVHRWA